MTIYYLNISNKENKAHYKPTKHVWVYDKYKPLYKALLNKNIGLIRVDTEKNKIINIQLIFNKSNVYKHIKPLSKTYKYIAEILNNFIKLNISNKYVKIKEIKDNYVYNGENFTKLTIYHKGGKYCNNFNIVIPTNDIIKLKLNVNSKICIYWSGENYIRYDKKATYYYYKEILKII